ncbi:MAG: aminoacyl-tRNA hydrolase [Betaproteobacteria bacterium]|jgi:PTH1 family peptidyl-tRNA hydrolase|nr:aminoacyl-tRNA hydrolase [Betaproteobacteria bacterium]
MAIRLIAGLGNPGRRYERDRHNAGFRFVQRLAERERVSLRSEAKFHGIAGKIAAATGDVWLLMPQTYMNDSGRSVAQLARFYKIVPEEILVVHDELDFEPGTVKLKLGGGVAGHNGLKDIHATFGTQAFWRLRIGIGHPGDRSQVADYVLHPPRPEENALIEEAIDRALDVAPLILAEDLTGAMHRLHTKPKLPPSPADEKSEE